MDALEAFANAVMGLVVSWLAVWGLFPLFGWPVSPQGAAGVTALFFGLSFVRAYLVRRLFRCLS